MNLSSLKYAPGSRRKRKRVGRGQGSGRGGTSTRGHKGQRSRAGAKRRRWFEGGQMPIQRRLPKRGFTNIFRQEYQIVNISQISHLEETEIDADTLKNKGLIKKIGQPVKLLGDGEIERAVKISIDAASNSAKSKIEAAGGEVIKI